MDVVPDDRRRAALLGLFNPASVAVVGASDDTAKWGHWLGVGALRGAGRRAVYLVNPNRSVILGQKTYARVVDLPEAPDLVVLAVPAPRLVAAVDDALAGGARALIAIAAGLSETGAPGAKIEQDLVARVREKGAVLLGPNCLGLSDVSAGLHLTSNDLPPGPVGLISQSGNLALELGALAEEQGIGFDRFVSVGNQADLEIADLLGVVAEARGVRALAVYGEDWRQGRRFLDEAAKLVRAGTPVVLLTVGAGPAAARAALSHTGALATAPAVMQAACRAAGIHLVRTPGEMVDRLQFLAFRSPPRGPRLAIVADGGGHGALAAEEAEHEGLEVPPLSAPAREALARIARGSTENPVDLAGAGEGDVHNFVRILRELERDDGVDAVLLSGYFGGYHVYGPAMAAAELETAAAMARWADHPGRTLVVHSMHRSSSSKALVRLREGHVPVYHRVEQAVGALAGAFRTLERRDSPMPAALPDPAPPLSSGGYMAARGLVAAAGIPLAPASLTKTAEEAVAQAELLGFPVVLKAAFLLHKSDAGGVILGLHDAEAVRAAFRDLRKRLGEGPVSVEAQAADGGVELLVGVRQDPRFGPIAMVGLGGVYAEVLDDVALNLAPVDSSDALAMLRRLRGRALLEGARGGVPLDLESASAALAALSRVAAAHPELEAVEVNPLRVYQKGVVALDARVVLAEPHRFGHPDAPPSPAPHP